MSARVSGWRIVGVVAAMVALTAVAAIGAEDDRLTQLGAATAGFAFDLLHEVSDGAENLFFSPLSVSIALSMLSAGADGQTLDQIADLLQLGEETEWVHPAYAELLALFDGLVELPYDEGQGFSLELANSLWLQDDFLVFTSFVDTIAGSYRGEVGLLDFAADPEAARRTINGWVSEKTRERIQELLAPGTVNEGTVFALVNAISFDAPWFIPFEEEATEPKPFTLLDGSTVTVDTMHDVRGVGYVAGDGFRAIELDYRADDVVMDIILPDAGRFSEVHDRLSAGGFDELLDAMTYERVDLALPKFSFGWDAQLNEPLKSLGMVDAFGPDADFARLTPETPFFVTLVVHQANVSVAEIGTEAAAATAILAFGGSGLPPPEPIPFTIDRPFLFVIRERETGTILFLGAVVDPT
ncbi:serpin family protein [Candidatus Bipolaricaulota bacterium]